MVALTIGFLLTGPQKLLGNRGLLGFGRLEESQNTNTSNRRVKWEDSGSSVYIIHIQVYIICLAQFLVFKDTRRPPARPPNICAFIFSQSRTWTINNNRVVVVVVVRALDYYELLFFFFLFLLMSNCRPNLFDRWLFWNFSAGKNMTIQLCKRSQFNLGIFPFFKFDWIQVYSLLRPPTCPGGV